MPIRFRYLTDYNEVEQLLLKEDIYKNILNTENLHKYFFNTAKMRCFAVYDNKTLFGIMILKEESPEYVSVHGGIYKEFQGNFHRIKKTMKALKKLIYPYHLMTTVRLNNIPAVKTVRKLGWKYKYTINSTAVYVE